jgi:hypothetical protein
MIAFVDRRRHAVFALCAILIAQSTGAVTLGQVDDFEDGTVQGWTDGINSPNAPVNLAGGPPGSTRYLSDVSSGTGTAGGKMTLFNQAQWVGDFIAAGITEIRAWVRVDPSSAGPLNLRIGFRAASEFGMLGHVSLNAVVVPDDGVWREVVFPIGSTDLVPTGFTFLNYTQTMSDVGHMRFINSANVDWQGQNFAATLGIDNITAGPLAPIPAQSILLRRSTDSRWFSYSLFGSEVVEKGRLDMTRSADYSIVSRADFDGDGAPDALLRDLLGGENGRWVLYTLQGTTITSQGFADLTRNPDWQLVATEDYDGDGDADVLLRNNVDGRWFLYLMNAQIVEAQGFVAMSVDLADQFAGTGDFNMDGRHDILIRRANGTWLMYFLNGLTAPTLGLPALTTNLDFSLVAIADFNGDTRSDTLLRRNDGRWFMYIMNGAAVETSGSPAITENNAFTHHSSADFDGDGNADVLLRRVDGRWFMYTLDGVSVATTGSPDLTRNLDFGIVSTVDFTDDGMADILMRRIDGRWVLYEMSGTSVLSTGIPDMARNPAWTPYGP